MIAASPRSQETANYREPILQTALQAIHTNKTTEPGYG